MSKMKHLTQMPVSMCSLPQVVVLKSIIKERNCQAVFVKLESNSILVKLSGRLFEPLELFNCT